MKAETRPADGMLYWAHILIYVDDILFMHHDPGMPLVKLDEYFKMKEGSIQVPTFYVGTKLRKTVFPNGAIAWALISRKDVQSAVQNVQENMTALPDSNKLLKKASVHFSGEYKHGFDDIPELDPIMANFFQS
jgi:hypothetical protein